MAPRKRTKATLAEKSLGVHGTVRGTSHALDYFTNAAARTGFGTPNLAEGAGYELVRFSYNYWELITLYRNHWISRRIVDMPAQDMVRAWPSLGGDTEPTDLTKLDKALRKTNSKSKLLTAIKWSRLFGGAGCLMVIDGQENELDQPIDLDKLELGSFKGLIPFDRWAGISPSGEICTDIKRPLDFNKPERYTVRGSGGESFEVHSSRVLTFNGPEVPTPEREAQSWWGISSLEPVYEEIRKRDNMSWNILSLTFRASILGMKFPDLAQLLSGVGSSQKASQAFAERMSEVNHLLSNQSLVPLPKDGGIESTGYSFSGLSEVYQQFQLDISGAAQIPVSRLWGRTITGLGQSNDADERIYEERIASDQDEQLRPQLEKLYPVLCVSELGEVPDDLELRFPSVRVLDEKEKSELGKAATDTVIVALNSGIISQRTAAKELKQASDLTGVFTNITDEDIEALSDKPQSEGELGEGLFGGLEPSSGPAKVIKEENKVARAADAMPSRTAEQMHLYHSLPVIIETPKDTMRRGDGWKTMMPADYGYIQGVTGADGAELDCYVCDCPESNNVYVVDQYQLDGKHFDEHKVVLGCHTQETALDTYMSGHHKSGRVFAAITPFTMPMFRQWMRTADLTKPCNPGVRV